MGRRWPPRRGVRGADGRQILSTLRSSVYNRGTQKPVQVVRGMEVVVATLGTEPQVVTLALDLLLGRGHCIGEVVVVHTHPAVVGEGLARLKGEEGHYQALRPPIRFRYVPVCDDRRYPQDIVSEEDAALLLRVLYRVVADLKRRGCRVHMCIAGGRKVMAAYGLAVAQLLLGEEDRVWHLLSPEPLLRSRAMHAADPSQVRLVPVPFLPWRALAPAAVELVVKDDPYAAIVRSLRWGLQARRAQAQLFLQRELTGAERRVVEVLVATGLPNAALAARLGLSPKTVANYVSAALDKARSFFGAPVDRARLVALLGPAVDTLPEEAGTASLEEKREGGSTSS